MSNSKSILVVEHEPLIMELIVEVLGDEGYPVRTTASGLAALNAIALDPPALTLFDMWLPDLDARGLLAKLEAMGLSYLQLILMTTSAQEAAPLLILGTISCLTKPFHIERLLALVADSMPSFPKPPNPHQVSRLASRWSVTPGGPLRRENNFRYHQH
ncbi:MAG TPA: response regulator [Roseiflexaceae bacterium]|nr:response regulator [Roseiflexaceae bacterium]